jgi:2-amino-4-hydroxy-6-hydroxymethyldihydropteridine diphosphokinase
VRVAAAAIGVGSNLGDRFDNLARAVEALRDRIGTLVALSRIYASAPVGFRDQPEFWNAAALFDTMLAPLQLLAQLQTIELELGRVASFPGGPRIIDLDLLLYDDDVVATASLVVPHPRLHERAFVLRPLAELVPARTHPLLARRIDALCGDVSAQHAIPLEEPSRQLHARLGLAVEH